MGGPYAAVYFIYKSQGQFSKKNDIGNETVNDIHAQAEKFSKRTEVVFRYMQVLTAALDAFAHGANDVANAMGPYAAVYFIYKSEGQFSKKNDVGNDMYWILAIGGFGIV